MFLFVPLWKQLMIFRGLETTKQLMFFMIMFPIELAINEAVNPICL